MAIKPRKVLKWIGISFGVFLVLLVATALIVPLVVDVDQFRPKIVEVSKQYLNGELKLGKLHLSLWGQVKVRVDGFSLNDAQGRNVVSAADVYFHVPFSSIFSGSPQLTFAMNKPEVTVIKDRNGINAMQLMKPAPATAAPSTPEAPSVPASPGTSSGSLPGIVTRARLGIEMQQARLAYVDKLTDLVSRVDALDVTVKDLSLSRPTEIEVSAMLDTRMGKVLSVKGPARLTASAQPQFKGTEFEKASVVLRADLDGVDIAYGELFHKAPGVPMNIDGKLTATPTSALIDSLTAKFHNAVINMSGGMTGLGTPAAEVTFKAASNDVTMAPWSQLVPMLKAYELTGAAAFKADAKGPLDKLQYQADLAIKALKAKAPSLKAQPQIDATVRIVPDKVERMEMTMRAPGNDLHVVGSVVSFTKPRANIQVTSTGMDLDQLMDFPKTPKKEAAAAPAVDSKKTSGSSAPSASSAKPASDFDALLEPLRENAVLAGTDAVFGFNLKFIKAMGIRIDPIEGQMSLKSLVANLDKFRMGVFDGLITSNASFDLKPKMPRYQFGMQVAGFDLKKAVSSQLEMFKNTAYGKLNLKMSGKGASFNPEPAKANLEASGNLSMTDAQFASIDVNKMAGEAINKALEGVAAQIPGLKDKKLVLGNVQTGYERMTANFSISKGTFSMPDFNAYSGKYRGLDVKGATTVGLIDYRLAAHWEVIDSNNVTGANNLTVESNGVRVERILCEPGQPVRFPIDVAGTLFAPAPSYTSVAESLTKVALANVARAAGEKLKQEAASKVKQELQKVVPNELKKALEGIKF
jgi:uncharacterized protein involved in outer membrane biogenesis